MDMYQYHMHTEQHKQANALNDPLEGNHDAEEDPLGQGNGEPQEPTRKSTDVTMTFHTRTFR